MVEMPREVFDLLTSDDPGVYKAMVTVNAEGVPNIAPMGSLRALDWNTIVFADIAQVHTRENLEAKRANRRVVVAIYKPPLTAYQVKGTFVGFQDYGQLYDNFSAVVAEKVEGASLRAVGLVAVDEVYASTPGQNSKKLA